MAKLKNQLRRCNCGKAWQTHEKGGKLFRCPDCGSTKKSHEIIEGRIYTSHRINPSEYSDILLKRTWHTTFQRLKGKYLNTKYCKKCKKLEKHLDHCREAICIYFKNQ